MRIKGDKISNGMAYAIFALTALMLVGCGSTGSNNVSKDAIEQKKIEEESAIPEPDVEKNDTSSQIKVDDNQKRTELEVYLDLDGKWSEEKAIFEVDTNLPDETELMLTLSKGDYNTDDSFTASTKVTVNNGIAKCDGFSNKGEKLSGEYDLCVSMSLPSIQTDAVRDVIGQNGEYMIGEYIDKSSINDSNVVRALYLISFNDEISIARTDDYSVTVFAEEDEDAVSAEELDGLSDEAEVAGFEELKVKTQIQEYIDEYYDSTDLDSLTVNPNLGTDEDGDYIVLVYLTWNTKNSGKMSKEMLDMYSSDMAARLYDDIPEIQELALFWTVPYLNDGSAKLSFERVEGGMKYSDVIFDRNFD